MRFEARWGHACGKARLFDVASFLIKHPQYNWVKGYMERRLTYTYDLVEFGGLE